MTCRFDREIILKYADNTIDPLELIFLKEHINYCNKCSKELELVITMENQLNKFFDYDSDAESLDMIIESLVDECLCELNKREKLKYALRRGLETGSGIMDNFLKFAEFIPGRKPLGKGVKKIVSVAGNFLTAIVKKSARKLLNNML
jgi:hypothetical protein